MLCRWSGPKSVVTVQREQVNEDECLVTYKLSGEKMFEKLDCTKSNSFSIAKDVHAEDDRIKNLMLVEGNVIVNRVWWPLRLDQTLPSKHESAMHADILEDMWDGCCTEWGAVPRVARDDSFSSETSASPNCSSSSEPSTCPQSSPRSRSRSREPDADIWRYRGKDKPQAIALDAASIQDACSKTCQTDVAASLFLRKLKRAFYTMQCHCVHTLKHGLRQNSLQGSCAACYI